jgi:hypothetical protein
MNGQQHPGAERSPKPPAPLREAWSRRQRNRKRHAAPVGGVSAIGCGTQVGQVAPDAPPFNPDHPDACRHCARTARARGENGPPPGFEERWGKLGDGS